MTTDRDIFLELRPHLMRFATALVGPDDAGDVVATVVARVVRRRELASLKEPRPYLMTAVANEARSVARSRGRRDRALARIGLPSTAPDPADSANPDVSNAVMALPVRQRAAIYLTYWEGMDSETAATHMGIRSGTLRRYLHLARESLRRSLNE